MKTLSLSDIAILGECLQFLIQQPNTTAGDFTQKIDLLITTLESVGFSHALGTAFGLRAFQQESLSKYQATNGVGGAHCTELAGLAKAVRTSLHHEANQYRAPRSLGKEDSMLRMT